MRMQPEQLVPNCGIVQEHAEQINAARTTINSLTAACFADEARRREYQSYADLAGERDLSVMEAYTANAQAQVRRQETAMRSMMNMRELIEGHEEAIDLHKEIHDQYDGCVPHPPYLMSPVQALVQGVLARLKRR